MVIIIPEERELHLKGLCEQLKDLFNSVNSSGRLYGVISGAKEAYRSNGGEEEG